MLVADEPRILLGTDRGPNATEAALYALSSCLVATLAYYAAAQGVRIEEAELNLEGDLDIRGFLGVSHEVRRGYERVRVSFRIRADAPREKLEELVRLAQMRSPVFDIVTNPTPVEVTLEQH